MDTTFAGRRVQEIAEKMPDTRKVDLSHAQLLDLVSAWEDDYRDAEAGRVNWRAGCICLAIVLVAVLATGCTPADYLPVEAGQR